MKATLFSLALLGLLAGCSGVEPDGSGTARVGIAGQALSGDVATIVVTVSAGAGPAFDPIEHTLGKQGTTWSAYVPGIPAGAGRHFEVAAYDALGILLYAGSATADVAPASVSSIAMVLQPSSVLAPETRAPAPPPGPGSTPVLEAVTAAPGVIAPGGQVLLTAVASDPDPGDVVSLTWSATCGAFITGATGPAVAWTAPAGAGSCELSVRATDASGASVSVSLVIAVRDAAGVL